MLYLILHVVPLRSRKIMYTTWEWTHIENVHIFSCTDYFCFFQPCPTKVLHVKRQIVWCTTMHASKNIAPAKTQPSVAQNRVASSLLWGHQTNDTNLPPKIVPACQPSNLVHFASCHWRSAGRFVSITCWGFIEFQKRQCIQPHCILGYCIGEPLYRRRAWRSAANSPFLRWTVV